MADERVWARGTAGGGVEEELFLEGGGGGDYAVEGAAYGKEAGEHVSQGEEMADGFEKLGG